MKREMVKIQVLRGILLVLIFSFHCGAPFAALGWGGVETFFIISAFFLTRKVMQVDKLSINNQIVHRIKRLYPPYIIILIMALIYSFIFLKRIPFDFPIFILSLQNLLWIKTQYISPMQPLTAHTWTISIEIWMGIIWLMLLSKLRSKEKIRVACFLFIIGAVMVRSFLIWLEFGELFITLFPLSHADAFGIGGVLALNSIERKQTKKRIVESIIAGAIGVIGILLSMHQMAQINGINIVQAYFLFSASNNYLNNLFSGNVYLFLSMVSFSILNLLIFSKNAISIFLKPIEIIGKLSYEFYLFHWPIVFMGENNSFIGERFPWYIRISMYFFISLIFAMLYNAFNTRIHNFNR